MNKFAEQFNKDVVARYQQKMTALVKQANSEFHLPKPGESVGQSLDNAVGDDLVRATGIPNAHDYFSSLDELDKVNDSFMDTTGLIGGDYLYPRLSPILSALNAFSPLVNK